jgi:hypothetical protein
MEVVSSRISRRRLLRSVGVGTAAVWLAPVVTTLNSRAQDCGSNCQPEQCIWSCGHPITCFRCGIGCGPLGIAYCSPDVDGNCFCWEDSACSELSDCVQNSDCPPGYACIPNTCCGRASVYSASGTGGGVNRNHTSSLPKCLPACGMGRRSSSRAVR